MLQGEVFEEMWSGGSNCSCRFGEIDMNTASELQRFALKLADKEEAGIFEMH